MIKGRRLGWKTLCLLVAGLGPIKSRVRETDPEVGKANSENIRTRTSFEKGACAV